jgi:NAD-dependent SIR2 family protein deacetylase
VGVHVLPQCPECGEILFFAKVVLFGGIVDAVTLSAFEG